MDNNISFGLPSDLEALLYAELLDNPFMGINITDGEGHVIFLNEAHTRITGHTHEQYMGKTMEELVNEGLISESATMHVLKTHEEVLLTQVVSNGKAFQVKGIPVFNEDRELIYVLNYLIDVSELVEVKGKMSEIEKYNEKLKNKYDILKQALGCKENLIFQSKIMQDIEEKAKRVAENDVTVLIIGPSGSGKEHIANIIYEHSKRKEGPFIKINCAAIPEHLFESEFFGYEPGAFTGGNPRGKKGIFEAAHNGTLLLDEVGELPLPLQSKLLRVLQEHEVRRLGSNKTIKVDFRLITSTNASLKEMVEKKTFRDDLYYRLNVIEIRVPGLEQRREDIPLLVEHFVKVFNEKYGKHKTVDKEVIKYLSSCNFPGNVRELKNVVERLVVQSGEAVILLQDAYEAIGILKIYINEGTAVVDIDVSSQSSLKELMSDYEKCILEEYMKIYGNGTTVARKLNTDQSTISRKLSKYKISM